MELFNFFFNETFQHCIHIANKRQMQVSASIPEQISNKLQGNGNGIVKKPLGK